MNDIVTHEYFGLALSLQPIGTTDLIAIVAATVALGAFFISRLQRRDAVRVEKSNAYLSLEVASSDIFRYEAENFDRLAPYQEIYASPSDALALKQSDEENAIIASNLYFQTLNLFEVCTRFRRQEVIEHEVFASWVTWFYDTLDDWYFRDQWPDLRGNYTRDIRNIFDIGVQIFTQMRVESGHERYDIHDDARRREFFRVVSEVMECEEIAGWNDEIAEAAVAVTREPMRINLFGWPKRTHVKKSPISLQIPSDQARPT
jgi:hypothetical protein